LHFDKPLGHAAHYLGFCQSEALIPKRIEHHRRGNGARLMAAVVEAGIDFELVRVWPEGSRAEERRLKAHGKARYCPVCNPRWQTNGIAPR
jgi:hypothetical protein